MLLLVAEAGDLEGSKLSIWRRDELNVVVVVVVAAKGLSVVYIFLGDFSSVGALPLN